MSELGITAPTFDPRGSIAVPVLRTIAYFSMEVGLMSSIPTYSGGLGVLAGDTIRGGADQRVPMVAMTLLHRSGYFQQSIDAHGHQAESPVNWAIAQAMIPCAEQVVVDIAGRPVHVGVWRRDLTGHDGFIVPVYFLDADRDTNSPADRRLTDALYGGDAAYRLAQEVILGVGGVRMLRALGYRDIQRFHLNEGHSALLTLELLRERAYLDEPVTVARDAVRAQCIFTTHTPVPSGHDRFPMTLANQVLGAANEDQIRKLCCFEGDLNLTYLALNLSRYVNGVAKSHGELSRHLYAGYCIDSITNGVHAATWATPPIADLFDRHISGWREDNLSLRNALGISVDEIRSAHRIAKMELLNRINRSTDAGLDADVFTVGFARRMTEYKQPDLIFEDLDRLRAIVAAVGPLQLVFAGKAHPQDLAGKRLIERIHEFRQRLQGTIRIVFLPDYDMDLGRLMTGGVDLWLNTPQPPLEASGTSGMKAAVNGVPSLSILDGWWIEGCIENRTGWAIGERLPPEVDYRVDGRVRHASNLYDKLERVIMPMFYGEPMAYADVMRHAIALNGSFFNTHRMVQQYVIKAYL